MIKISENMSLFRYFLVRNKIYEFEDSHDSVDVSKLRVYKDSFYIEFETLNNVSPEVLKTVLSDLVATFDGIGGISSIVEDKEEEKETFKVNFASEDMENRAECIVVPLALLLVMILHEFLPLL